MRSSVFLLFVAVSFVAIYCANTQGAQPGEEPLLLLGTIVKWQYPQSELRNSEMSDGATLDVQGNRTVSSTLLKTTMLTDESVSKVVDFYQKLLAAPRDKKDHPLGYALKEGVSVIFGDDSEGTDSMQTVLINSATRSTTVVISRMPDDMKTRIVWKQYVRDTK